MSSIKRHEIITTRVDPETKAELERRATADDRKLSAYVARILKAHVADEGKQRSTAKGRG